MSEPAGTFPPVPKKPPDKVLSGVQSSDSSRRMNTTSNPNDPPGQDVEEDVAPPRVRQNAPNLPRSDQFRNSSDNQGQNVDHGINFRAATAGVEAGSHTKWILFNMEKSLRSQTWSLNDKEIAQFIYKTLKLKKGQAVSLGVVANSQK